MPLDWHSVVNTMTDVQRLVHLAMRQDAIDEDRTRTELLRQARRIFEEELTIQAGRVGCPGRRGRLSNGPILTEINELCKTWATSQINTYNYDLAGAILSIAADTPSANRNTYTKRLQEWDASRQSQRGPLIAQYIEGAVRALANQHFYEQNGAALGYAILQPSEAVCPVCQGWIQRGEVPLKVAMNNPPPYHFRCPHSFTIYPDKWSPDDCPILWMGE